MTAPSIKKTGFSPIDGYYRSSLKNAVKTSFDVSLEPINSSGMTPKNIKDERKTQTSVWVGARIKNNNGSERLVQVAIARDKNGIFQVITGQPVSLDTKDQAVAVKNTKKLLEANFFEKTKNEVDLPAEYSRVGKPIWVGASIVKDKNQTKQLAQVAIARNANGIFQVISGKPVSLNTQDPATAIKNAKLLLNINYFNKRGKQVALAPQYARTQPTPQLSNDLSRTKKGDPSIIIDAAHSFMLGIAAYGLPDTPSSFVDSIRITTDVAGLVSLSNALKSGKDSGDIKLSIYAELTIPEIRIGNRIIPKGKADYVFSLSSVGQYKNGKFILKTTTGFTGLLVSQDAWRGFGPHTMAGYSGFLWKAEIGDNQPLKQGLASLSGQAEALKKDFEKQKNGKKTIIGGVKFNGYFYDSDNIESQGGVFNPIAIRGAQKIAKAGLGKITPTSPKIVKNLGVGLNIGRFVDNFKNSLDAQPHYFNGRIQKATYTASGYIMAGVPALPSAPGLVVGPTFGLNGSISFAGTGNPDIQLNLPNGQKQRIDIKGISKILSPLVNTFSNMFSKFTAQKDFENQVKIACVFQARRDALALRQAAELQASDVKKVWIDHAAIIENNANTQLDNLKKDNPKHFDPRTGKLFPVSFQNANSIYIGNKKLIENETRPLIPATATLSREEYRAILQARKK